MKYVVSVIGRFHSFSLAREFENCGYLEAIYTGYPRQKVQREGLPPDKVRCFPWLWAPFMAANQIGFKSKKFKNDWVWASVNTFDAHVARNVPKCDAIVALSSNGLSSGRKVQAGGGIYVCDRCSSHIRFQDRIMREERARLGLKEEVVVDPRMIDREEEEYRQADLIHIPSSFAFQSFVDEGVSPDKLRRVPYGVELSKFSPSEPPSDDSFDVLFAGTASVRKGAIYLLRAFRELKHPRKTLTFVGGAEPEIAGMIEKEAATTAGITMTGLIPQPELARIMSKSHVMVLPSIEEGLAYVQGQALACGCPVIGTTNSGAEDLFTDGVEGYVVPIRDSAAILERLQFLADNPDKRSQMSKAATERVSSWGGWRDYGNTVMESLSGVSLASRA